jgi:DNA-binding beta-propeller fold protein YncE
VERRFSSLFAWVLKSLQEKKMRVLRMVALLLAGMGLAASVSAQAKWSVEKTMHIGGAGGWDYVTVDAAHHRFFVTRSTHTQVIDTNTGKVLADIAGQIRSHGVALAPDAHRGFITDGGGSGQIVVFDLKTYKVLGKLNAMPDADGIIYDAGTNNVLAVSGDGHALMTFPPNIDLNGKIPPPIELGGSPEFLAANGQGKVFVNLPDKNEVAIVDLQSRRVVARWPVAPGGENVGMAYDAETHRLFLGCRKPAKLIVMDSRNGDVLASLPIGEGNDAVKFGGGQAFASCRDGSLTVAGQRDGKWVVDQVVKTALGARTMGIDQRTHTIYLPTAEEMPAQAGARRPQMKPDSFEIVVVKR